MGKFRTLRMVVLGIKGPLRSWHSALRMNRIFGAIPDLDTFCLLLVNSFHILKVRHWDTSNGMHGFGLKTAICDMKPLVGSK